MTTETLDFGADVGRVLDIVARSLYSQREVFLRELISNASDACDRLRYQAIAEPGLMAHDGTFRIDLVPDADNRRLTIRDNGLGMDRADLVENLGTIAKSGTLAAVQAAAASGQDAPHLIGQFGVGFYSAFMVADRVEVVTRKAGTDGLWRWQSDGKGTYQIDQPGGDAVPDGFTHGTVITLHLQEDAAEFTETHRLSHVVRAHSDHVGVPVYLTKPDEDEPEQLNRAAALWTRPKSEISEEEYRDFYAHVGGGMDEPYATLHWRAEGMMEYTVLAYLPSRPPFDLFMPERKHHLRLYVRRVFVSEAAEGLLPPWLRFLRGVVDSEDLPLNVSRETLQSNPMITRMKNGIVKRVVSELTKRSEDADQRAGYETFWESFGAVLKEGLYEDHENRKALLKLARFRSTRRDGWVSLEEYVAGMRPGQEAIYILSGEDEQALKRSPQLEGFRARDVEVLLLTDPVDEFWVPMVGEHVVTDEDGKETRYPLKSVTRGGADLAGIEKPADADGQEDEAESEEAASQVDKLIATVKLTLGDAVKDVRASERLTESPVCLVADENDLDMHLERMLKQSKQLDTASRRILEINPKHALVKRLAAGGEEAVQREMAWLLLDQARIVEGEPVPDPAAFAKRLSEAMMRGLG